MKNIILFLMLLGLPAFALKSASKHIVTNGDMSQATVASQGILVEEIQLGSIQGVWTGAALNGTFTLEVSNDDVAVGTTDQGSNVVNWTTFPGSSIAINASGDLIYNIADMGYKWARVVYTRVAGTGTLNEVMIVKQDNK